MSEIKQESGENQSPLKFLAPQSYLQNHDITILIVDDSADNLRVLSSTLSEYSYDVRCAKSGVTALQAIQIELPDLILLDIRMPDMDGYEVCKQLKSEPRTQQIPIIFISALGDALDKVKAFSIGGADYITKPFQAEEVVVRIQNQLNLHIAKIQLAHAEKMASLGQMLAGITHEIKNPLSFISGNVDYMAEGVTSILEILELYQKHYPNPPQVIQEKTQTVDLDHIKRDLPKILRSMDTGVYRIVDIIQTLNTFSRPDKTGVQTIDIHKGIESTLSMLGHRLQANHHRNDIQIIKDFEQLPHIKGYPGMLNQVFMNIIVNAIDAIDEQTSNADKSFKLLPRIRIQTRQTDNLWISIHIQDNGPGMTEKVSKYLFNPFFTTKADNKGTGLVLTISHQIIVEKHHGTLHFYSKIEQGTEFVIRLPIRTINK